MNELGHSLAEAKNDNGSLLDRALPPDALTASPSLPALHNTRRPFKSLPVYLPPTFSFGESPVDSVTMADLAFLGKWRQQLEVGETIPSKKPDVCCISCGVAILTRKVSHLLARS